VKSAVDRLADSLPAAFDIALGFAALWGIFLWLFGRRIVRSSLTFIALMIGAVIGGFVGRSMGDNTAVIVAVAIGAIGAAVLAWVTFRLWVAVLLALMLGACTPWAVLAWKGEPLPRVHQPMSDAVRDAAGEAQRALKPDGGIFAPDDGGEDGEAVIDTEPDGEQPKLDIPERFVQAGKETWQALRDWWSGQSGGLRTLMVIGGLGMMAGGFLIGLVFPNLASAIAASLVGSSIVLIALLRLSAQYAEGLHAKLPTTPRGVLMMLVSATIIGALIQWTVLGKRADN